MDKSNCTARNTGGSSRRDFLRVGSLCPLGIGLAQFLHASRGLSQNGREGKAQACILLWLEGGPAVRACGTNPFP